MPALSDERLLRRLKTQPEPALGELLERYWAPAYRVALQTTRDPMAAEDAAQDAFLRLLDKAGSFDRERTFRPWFLRIVSNCARDRAKARSRRARHERRAARPDFARDVEALDSDTRDRLWDGLNELRPEQRAAVSLHVIEGLSFREVAEVLECPEGTAASRCRRGLKTLRKELSPTFAVSPLVALIAGLEVQAPARPTAKSLLGGGALAAGGAAGLALGAKALLAVVGVVALGGLAAWGVGALGGDPPSSPPKVAEAPPVEGSDSAASVASSTSPVDRPAADSPVDTAPAAPDPAGPKPAEFVADPAQPAYVVRLVKAGAPLAGVELVATQVRYGTPEDPLVFGATVRATTDAAGVGRLTLDDGAWDLRVGPPPGLELGEGSYAPLEVHGDRCAGVLLGVEPNSWGGLLSWRVLAGEGRELTVTVLPFAVIRGRVVRAHDGGPVAEPKVTLVRWDAQGNAQGEFALLAPLDDVDSTARVGASAAGYAYGDAGATPEKPVRIELEEGVELRVQVLTPDGSPAAGYHVELGSPSGMQVSTTTGHDGRFRLGELPTNRGEGYSVAYVTVRLPSGERYTEDVLARDGYEHVLRLPRYVQQTGTLRLEGQPVDGVDVSFYVDGEATSGASSGEEGVNYEDEPQPASGRFVLSELTGQPGWLVVGLPRRDDFAISILDDEGPSAVGVHARPLTPGPPIEVALLPRAETPVTVRHTLGGGAARRATLRVYPLAEGAGRPVLLQAQADRDGVCVLAELARGGRYAIVAELADGRQAQGTVTGGQPCELVLPGAALGDYARVRLRAKRPDGQPAAVPTVRVFAAADPRHQVGGLDVGEQWVALDVNGLPDFEAEELSEGEPEEPGVLGVDVYPVGDVWVEVTDFEYRGVIRAQAKSGATIELGTLDLKPLVEVPCTLRFDPSEITVQELVLEWNDPASGIPMESRETMLHAPGVQPTLRLPAGELTVRPRYRSVRGGPLTELPPVELRVDPAHPVTLELDVE